MNKICKRTPYLILGLMLIGIIIFIGCEAENPGEPRANLEPETYISEASPGVTTIISWYGTDKDGRVESFQYRWDDGDWVETEEMTGTFQNIFSDLSDQHTFYVMAGDNRNGWDPTPASVTLSPVTISPETKILEGPQLGSVVGSDVRFAWEGEDKDGRIAGYEYTMDDISSWTVVDSTVTEALFLDLADGAHTFFVKAVDNLGARDESPAQVSFVVKPGFAPILTNTSPISDGAGWFSGVSVTFSWTVDVSHYEGQLPQGACTFALDDSTGFDSDNANLKIPWNPRTSYAIAADDVTPGDHAFYIKIRDTNNQVVKMRIRFSAAAPTFDKGILVVNGVAPSYGDEVTTAYADQVFWGSHDVDFWDLFGNMSAPGVSTIPSGAEYIGGGSAVSPDIFAQYSSVVWVGNSFSGDEELWHVSPAYPYLLAGGNLILTTRYGSGFFSDDFTAYVGVGWRSEGVVTQYDAIMPGLLDMTPFTETRADGLAGTEPFSMGAFTNNEGISHEDPIAEDGWYHNSDGTATLLFANWTDYGITRGLGVWTHPNLVLGANQEVTFPISGDQAQGNFVFLAGRNYGYNHENAKHNFEFILTNFFGEQ